MTCSGSRLVFAVVVLALTACASGAGEVQGVWRYASFTIDGTTEQVEAGVNATRVPWAVVDDEAVSGHAGCNEYGGPYELTGTALTSEVFKNAAWCGPEEGSLMDAELAFEAVVWQDSPVQVSFEGDRMVWSNGPDRLEFVPIESPPTTEPFEPEPQTSVGRLNCSPGFVAETRVPDTGQDPLEIAREADASVVEVEPGQPLWHAGLDANGEVVVELALGDMPGADYQVWTCED